MLMLNISLHLLRAYYYWLLVQCLVQFSNSDQMKLLFFFIFGDSSWQTLSFTILALTEKNEIETVLYLLKIWTCSDE